MNQGGFTYLMALMLVMIMGIMLGAVGQSWTMVMQREREEELLFRGAQIKDAINRWYNPRGLQQQATPLRDLKDLVQDPRSLTSVRYLRRLYTDPMTTKDWTIIKDPSLGITGVASTSQEAPLKVNDFPDDLASLTDKKHYSDWQFVYMPDQQPVGTNTTTPGATK